jgi:hypothetical protein
MYLPVPLIVKRKNGHTFVLGTLQGQLADKRIVPQIGRAFDAQKLLARTPKGRSRRTWFVLEKDILDIEQAASIPKSPPPPPIPKPRPQADNIGSDWIISTQMEALTGAYRSVLIGVRRNVGDVPFPGEKRVNGDGRRSVGLKCADGKHYPVDAKVALIPQGKPFRRKGKTFPARVIPTAVYYRPHGETIQKAGGYLAPGRRARNRDAIIFAPFKHTDGTMRLRDRGVARRFEERGLKYPHDATVERWTSRAAGGGCPAFGGGVVDRIIVDSVASTRAEEGAWLLDHVDRLLEQLIKTPRELDPADFAMLNGEVYLPQHLARQYVPDQVLKEERAKPAASRVVRIEKSKLPFRHDRDWWDKKQDVFSEEDMLRHPLAARTTPLHAWNMSTRAGEVAFPAVRQLSRAKTPLRDGKKPAHRPRIEGEPRQKRLELMTRFHRREKGVSRTVFCEQEGLSTSEFQSIYMWFKTQPEAKQFIG